MINKKEFIMIDFKQLEKKRKEKFNLLIYILIIGMSFALIALHIEPQTENNNQVIHSNIK